MKRREFISRTAYGLGGAWLGSTALARLAVATPTKFNATDIVTLGNTGIKTSRLACGTGTVGVEHHSHQSALGIQGLADLLRHGYDQGLRFFDTADSYGTHPHVAAALKQVPREKVTILTKSWARDARGMRADLDRFRRELNTDYLDICLMHCLTEDDWTERFRPVMDVLSEAREKGMIRAHGCSCHSSAPSARPQSRHGSRLIWPASIPSGRTWTPTLARLFRFCGRCARQGRR